LDVRDYQVLFLVVVAVSALLVASPALSRLLVLPRTEFFTELWILGPNHMAEDYPSNISRDQNYSIYLGVANHLGYCAYYVVEVKFRNETEPSPTNVTASSLPSLYNVSAFAVDEGVWEVPLKFAFDYGVNESVRQVEFHSLAFNDVMLDLGGRSAAWDSDRSEFCGYLFFELWIYNTTISSFQFHQRAVWLSLNMTF
jgi:uncharacterized membrane protein